MVTPGLLKGIPMLSDLQDTELAGISACFTEEEIAPGETLYVEGDPATCACFAISGEIEVLKALPGGGAAQIAVIEPGSMIGEMALVAGETRTATVRAITKSTVLTVQRDFFHAALDQISVPAYKILRGVIQNVAVRLDELQERILRHWDCDDCDAYVPSTDGSGAEHTARAEGTEQSPSFDFRRFLPVIPFFVPFTEGETDRLVARARVVELSRGEYAYREGSPAQSCFLIVRGAIETSVSRDRRYQLSILGPGRIFGANSLITDRRCRSDTRVRSAALLLGFDRSAFRHLYSGDTVDCLKFQRMLSRNQLQDRRAADNLLSTLVSQDYVSGGVRQHGL
jgi:CRP-like cAMP-binding protein